VNKVATKVDLRVDLSAIEGLSQAARDRLVALAASRLDADGRLVVTSQVTRTQSRNLEDAREKVRRLVAAALTRPRARIASTAPAGADQRRLATKRHRATVKQSRGRPATDD
jgi:ribosome-associated protein